MGRVFTQPRSISEVGARIRHVRFPPISDQVADIVTDTVIQGYKGPGAYDIADLAGSLGGFQVAVVHDRFVADANTVGSATLAGDGSGSVTATGMQPAGDSNDVQEPVDVTFTWSCLAK